MGRKPKIRSSYRDDASYLTRLGVAVEGDIKRAPEWRKEVLEHLNALTFMFLSVEDMEVVNAPKRQGKAKANRA